MIRPELVREAAPQWFESGDNPARGGALTETIGDVMARNKTFRGRVGDTLTGGQPTPAPPAPPGLNG